jgi:hypothetical protein
LGADLGDRAGVGGTDGVGVGRFVGITLGALDVAGDSSDGGSADEEASTREPRACSISIAVGDDTLGAGVEKSL